MPPSPPFSKRRGFTSQPKEITIREDAPKNLRTFVLLTVKDELGFQWSLLRQVLCRVLREVPDENNWTEDPNIRHEVEELLGACDWFKVYDFIEALHEHFGECDHDTGSKYAPRFADEINSFFIEKGIGWQLVNGAVEMRGDEVFEGTVRTASRVLEKDEKPTAAGHLRFAIAALSARPKPNTSGAVAHATSAVECVLGEVTGQPMTLGEYLKNYPDLFHPALKKALHGIYGYASDEGARHGKEGTEPSREDAEFAVAVCAAVCTLLTRRHPNDRRRRHQIHGRA
jgi:hypothetical protein